jgi:ribosome-associated protein
LTEAKKATHPLALAAVRWAGEKSAVDPALLDLRELCSYTDYLLVLGGRSTRQVRAIAEAIVDGMRSEGHRTLGTEGLTEGRWALLDFGRVVVHVFLEELREHYDLESLWDEAPRVDVTRLLAAASRDVD